MPFVKPEDLRAAPCYAPHSLETRTLALRPCASALCAPCATDLGFGIVGFLFRRRRIGLETNYPKSIQDTFPTPSQRFCVSHYRLYAFSLQTVYVSLTFPRLYFTGLFPEGFASTSLSRVPRAHTSTFLRAWLRVPFRLSLRHSSSFPAVPHRPSPRSFGSFFHVPFGLPFGFLLVIFPFPLIHSESTCLIRACSRSSHLRRPCVTDALVSSSDGGASRSVTAHPAITYRGPSSASHCPTYASHLSTYAPRLLVAPGRMRWSAVYVQVRCDGLRLHTVIWEVAAWGEIVLVLGGHSRRDRQNLRYGATVCGCRGG